MGAAEGEVAADQEWRNQHGLAGLAQDAGGVALDPPKTGVAGGVLVRHGG
ncbi:MAG TPA: hypothetical protein PKY77_16735 [Phycisphaerae bacterium]|nr:hypothetical protein [Phycisphaerae bacterium]HRY69876.1 hypothetical protein [Phycisphaerae bacterium]HSA25397.1 hypothetical protein [Phycisphaerae bacterium]